MKAKCLLPVALIVTLGLAGCGGIFGRGHSSMASADSSNVDDIYRDYATDQLELGRNRIQHGALTEALEPLRRASFNPATAAAAHNAMGVVYARLGRRDVAERMFRLAMEENPDEPKFAANLERLEAAGMAAASPAAVPALTAQAGNGGAMPLAALAPANAMGAPAIQAAKDAPVVQTMRPTYGGAIQISQPSGPIQRLSQYEVRVGGPTIPARSARVRQAYAGDLPNYPQRIRIEVSGPPSLRTDRPSAAYPVRVNF